MLSCRLKQQQSFTEFYLFASVLVCVNSPSLECDSGEEDILGHSYPCSSVKKQSILRSSSGEERDSFETSPDFNRTHSDSTHTSTKVNPRETCCIPTNSVFRVSTGS